MANRTSAKRTLTAQEVIDLVASVDVPVLRIERQLRIPTSVLQRALKPDTLKPLPVKYEKPLLDFINAHLSGLKALEDKKVATLARTEKRQYQKEVTASAEEVASKNKWVEDIRRLKAGLVIG